MITELEVRLSNEYQMADWVSKDNSATRNDGWPYTCRTIYIADITKESPGATLNRLRPGRIPSPMA